MNTLEIEIINCIFDNNKAYNGGAVSSTSPFSSYILTDCKFTNNSASSSNLSGGTGGAVYFHSIYFTSATFTNSTFTNNNASNYGGAVYSSSDATFTNCTFANNSASQGGAVVCLPSWGNTSTFTNCSFTNNSAPVGGVFYGQSPTSFMNCTFTSNRGHTGGAVYFFQSSITLTNCTFTLNEAGDRGGAIFFNSPVANEDPIKNCILWGNSAAFEGSEIYEGDKPLIITYSNIQGGHTGTGNIDEDPLFIDVDNDFHLQETSPCIDSGTADGAPADDLDGNYRPVGNGFDMGAYEYQPPIIIDSFTASPTTGKPSLVVDFTCTAHDDTNTITDYQWNFGDGNTDSTPTGTIQHTYIIPGTFTATCTIVNDNADQTTASTTIEVTNDIPIADAGPDQIIPGSSVELNGSASNDPDGSISSWEWSLIHTENPAYNKSASGEVVYLSDLEYGHYTVTLTVTDNFGAHGVDEMFLSIAASTGDVYSQDDLDNARQDGYDQGYLEGMDEGLNNSGNTIAGIIEEGANGEKVINGPVIIKGTLVIE